MIKGEHIRGVYSPLTVFYVEAGDEEAEQTSHRHWCHDLAVAVVRTQGERALAQVCQTLREAHTEEVVGVFAVVDCQLSQHLR